MASKFFERFAQKSGNLLSSFSDNESVIKAVDAALRGTEDNAYVVIDDFVVSPEIASRLNPGNDLAMIIPRPHLKDIARNHRINGEVVYKAIHKASNAPNYIFFDWLRGNYRFIVEIDDSTHPQHRLAIDFHVAPDFDPDLKANVLRSLFPDSKNYKNSIDKLKNDPNAKVVFVYGNEEGWTESVNLSRILQQEELIHHARDSWARGGSQGNSNAASLETSIPSSDRKVKNGWRK